MPLISEEFEEFPLVLMVMEVNHLLEIEIVYKE
jgi:hypothetical protein